MSSCKEIIRVGPLEMRILKESEDTDGTVTLFEFLVPPQAKVPAPHYHEHFEETLYGLEGELTFAVDGQDHLIGPGDTCFVKRGAVHGFVNNGSVTSRTLAIISPAVFGAAYFREIGAAIGNGPPDPEQVAQVMRRHGLVAVLS